MYSWCLAIMLMLPTLPVPDTISNDAYSCRVYALPEGGFGYRIYRNQRLFIDQPYIPALPGRKAFRSRRDAGKVANLVLEKLRKGIMPPAITREELGKLAIDISEKISAPHSIP